VDGIVPGSLECRRLYFAVAAVIAKCMNHEIFCSLNTVKMEYSNKIAPTKLELDVPTVNGKSEFDELSFTICVNILYCVPLLPKPHTEVKSTIVNKISQRVRSTNRWLRNKSVPSPSTSGKEGSQQDDSGYNTMDEHADHSGYNTMDEHANEDGDADEDYWSVRDGGVDDSMIATLDVTTAAPPLSQYIQHSSFLSYIK
jgi:hypothetical protein